MIQFEEKANDLIGKPYKAYGANCWDLVTDLVPEAPYIKASADSLKRSVETFKKELDINDLEEVQMLYNKDIVVMGRDDVYFHAGVYYNGGVIHASTDGVVYEPIGTIHRHYNCVKGFRV